MNCANHPDRERVAFCQNCGKPLCQECTRTVGTAVFCEPCLVAKLAGNAAPFSSGGSYTGPSGTDYPVEGAIPIPPPPGEPNPGLAALLGFIPGVGAMYNGQYAKGIVHLVVFAILVSLANENGIFGLFIAGWVFYQVIEAHHTARARRDGTPLPNPFGLNDLGERLGFGKAWPGTPGQHAAPTAGPGIPPTSPYPPPPTSNPGYAPPSAAAWNEHWNWENYAPPVPPVPPYGSPIYPPPPDVSYSRNRFPAGAIWLIALGSIFLIGNAGIFHGFPVQRLVPFFLIGLGIWLFVHKMTDTGTGLADDGTPAYRLRLFRALRGSIWVLLVGVMFLLSTFNILSWGHSWPLFIIVAGLMTIFERTAYSAAVASSYPYPPQQPPPPPAAPPEASSTSIIPSSQHDRDQYDRDQHDQEGR
jgi:hypothetical protein